MRKKKKVLFILPSLHAGGAENYTLRFIRYCKHEFTFGVLSVNNQKGDLHEDFINEGVDIRYQSIGYFNPLKWLQLMLFLRKERFDSICTMNGNFGGIPIFLARFVGIQNRIAFYRRSTIAFSPTKLRLRYNDFANGLVFKHATKVFSNSRFAFHNFFENKFQTDKRFRVLPNGVNPSVVEAPQTKEFYRKKFGIPLDAFVVGHVGRFDPAKNHDIIFKAAQQLISSSDSFIFVFCGKDTDSEKFRSVAENYQVSKHSIFLGLQERVGEVLKCLDIFFFPSLTEGQPNALIEAMLSGLPVIASNIEPIKEAIPESSHARLIDPTDSKSAVAIINAIKGNESISNQYKFEDWAKRTFDFQNNMNAFKNEL